MEIEKSKVLIKFLINFRQSGDVLFFLNVRWLRGYTATAALTAFNWKIPALTAFNRKNSAVDDVEPEK